MAGQHHLRDGKAHGVDGEGQQMTADPVEGGHDRPAQSHQAQAAVIWSGRIAQITGRKVNGVAGTTEEKPSIGVVGTALVGVVQGRPHRYAETQDHCQYHAAEDQAFCCGSIRSA